MEKRRAAVLAVGTVLVLLACSDGIDMMGDAMVDAGETLIDAGDVLDGATSDAGAQVMTFETECEPHIVERITDRASGTVVDETTHYYAEVSVPGLSAEAVESALAVMCDKEILGLPPAGCPAERICEPTPVTPLACNTDTPQIEDGRVRVRCGQSRTLRAADGTGTVVVGDRWRRVRFVVR